MFDFARKVKLALGDTARRAALKAGAGVLGLIAGGFLLAALWSFLATELGWGSALASLAIAVLLAVIAAVLIALGSRRKHEMPSTDDLKREVEARATLAADAAAAKARSEAARVMDMAETKAHALMDQASFRATKLASDAERKVLGSVRETARAVGLSSQVPRSTHPVFSEGQPQVRPAPGNAGDMTKMIGILAVGITLAAKLQESRRRDRDLDPDDLM
nr:phage holin family protein [Paracoccus saliphilus]